LNFHPPIKSVNSRPNPHAPDPGDTGGSILP
jgi:hypothetical protein